MSIFESKITINRPIHDVYSFLADLNNHRQLMADAVEDWNSTFNTASFNIPNMIKLSLKVESRIEDREIKIIPSEKAPFDLELIWALSSKNNNTEVLFTITADLNMMMKMIASGPLQKLADQETKNLASLMG
jgi:carbon monoxide dehydrogenase subunit G